MTVGYKTCLNQEKNYNLTAYGQRAKVQDKFVRELTSLIMHAHVYMSLLLIFFI
jgi:hypothetical protein